MGRHVAGASFLSAMARYAAASELVAVTPTAEHFADFQARVTAAKASRAVRWIPASEPETLAEVGCLFYPGVPPADWAWIRRRDGQRRFSLCGITHTTASVRAMKAVGELLVAPFQSWDALICTSKAVYEMVEQLLDGYEDYLSARMGGLKPDRPQRPIIPLGVDCEALAPGTMAASRGRALRARAGIPLDAFVVLFVGRLSFHAKAHPLPLYLALECAAQRSPGPLYLLLAGWFANDGTQKQFEDAARLFCPSVQVVTVDGRNPEIQHDVWHAADIFASPSDNIQETFGLAPVEAMAAGLPTVVSDWDGYRDGPRHGVEGFLIPTWLAPAGSGEDLARRHQLEIDDYDHYIGHAGQFAAVEVAAMARAFETLMVRPELRQEMGVRARRRAVAAFDWPVIIAQYEELWTELAARRSAEEENAPVRPHASPAPLNADPFALFAGYPSERLHADTLVSLLPGAVPHALHERTSLFMNALARALICRPETLDALFTELDRHRECRSADLLGALSPADRRAVQRTLVWLAKLDLVRLRNPDS